MFLFPSKDGSTKSADSCLQVPPTETTALLTSPVPRIQPVDDELPGGDVSLSVFRQEAKTLIRYALPVFGFVDSVSISQRTV